MEKLRILGRSCSALLLLLLVSCGAEENQQQNHNEVPPATLVAEEELTPASTPLIKKENLQLLSVANGARATQTTLSGRVIAKHSTQLFAEVQGRILPGSIQFKSGVRFKKGEVLLQLEREEFKLDLEAQRSAFLNALTGLMPDMKSDYPESYESWTTYIRNYTFGTSLPPLPEPRSEEEKYYITSNQIYNQYFSIKAREKRLEKYTIYAPYSGMITSANIDLGSLVNPGQSLGTIISSYDYELEAGVDIAIADQLKIGQQIRFRSNKVGGEWLGTVVRTTNVVDARTQNVPVFFRLKGKRIRPGMYLEGTFQTKGHADVSVIPTQALGRDESVLVLDQDIIVRKPVQPVEFLQDSIIITGLKDNEMVILNTFDKPVEGNKVQI